MEIFLNVVVVVATFAIMFVLDRMGRKPVTAEHLANYQKQLDAADARLKKDYGLDIKRDASQEIERARNEAKGFTLILFGILFGVVDIILFVVSFFSILNFMVGAVSSVWLIFYGLSKFASHLKILLVILAIAVVFGFIISSMIDKIISLSPYGYIYLTGFIILIAVYLQIKSKKR